VKRRTLVVVGALFVGLLLLRGVRERERERAGGAGQEPLFAGASPDRVADVRVEDLRSGDVLRLERDAARTWYLTEPVAYPARSEVVGRLLAELTGGQAERVASVEPGRVGLDPPAIVLELSWRGSDADGARHRGRLELGAVDVDPRSVHARASTDGGEPRELLVSRTLLTTLERSSDDFREARITPLRGEAVAFLRRSGSLRLEPDEPAVDLALVAERRGGDWSRVDCARVGLDPNGIGALARVGAGLEAIRFVDDSPTDLAPYGLDDAELNVELGAEDGSRASLHFARRADERGTSGREARWFARREGWSTVFEVRWNDVYVLAQPAEAIYDYQLSRLRRGDVARLEIEGDRGGARLTRVDETWWVAAGDAERHPADPDAVADLLAVLESGVVERYLEDAAFPVESGCHLRAETRDGRRFGVRFGPLWRDPEGGEERRMVLRDGDELPGLVDPALAAWCAASAGELRSLQVHRLAETSVDRVELERAGRTRVYERRGDADWLAAGAPEALPPGSPFFPVLEALCSLRVEAWEPSAAAADAPGDRVDVRLVGAFGRRDFALVRAGDGAVTLRLPDGAAGAWRADRYEALAGLLE